MAATFDLRQLRYFVAIAECGSFRAAAEQLHVSQPPLSRQIKDLESALGARLFDRRPSGIALTGAGKAALVHAHAILREVDGLASAFSPALGSTHRSLRIGITAAVTVADRARLTRAWLKAFPAAALDVQTGFSRDFIPALKEGRLDFALVGLPGNLAGLQAREVHVSRLAAALPSRHRLAKRARVSLLDVTDLPLFWIPRSHHPAYHDFCMRYFHAIGYRPETIVVEPGQLQTLERIAQGEGWTIPNGATLETRVRGVAYRPLVEGEDLAVRIVAAWRKDTGEGRWLQLADVAARILGARAPTRRKAGRRG